MNYWDDYRPGWEDEAEESFWLKDRQRAIKWANQKLQEDCLILDTETTGLHGKAEAVQIAIIDSNGKQVFETLINPIGNIDPKAKAIHGLSREKLIHAPTFSKVYSKLKFLLESKKILIYNADFDTRIINQQCHLNDLPSIKINAECVMIPYSAFCGDWSEYHQSYTWQRLPGGDHSAIGDCQATLAVIKEMAND